MATGRVPFETKARGHVLMRIGAAADGKNPQIPVADNAPIASPMTR